MYSLSIYFSSFLFWCAENLLTLMVIGKKLFEKKRNAMVPVCFAQLWHHFSLCALRDKVINVTEPTTNLDFWNYSEETEDNQHVDQSNHLPQSNHTSWNRISVNIRVNRHIKAFGEEIRRFVLEQHTHTSSYGILYVMNMAI